MKWRTCSPRRSGLGRSATGSCLLPAWIR